MRSPAGLPTPPTQAPNAPAATPQPSIAELFLAFAAISLSGFGGVLAWARRIMVERRRWFTADQFNEAFALCALPPKAVIGCGCWDVRFVPKADVDRWRR